MYAKYLGRDDGGYWQRVENVDESLPRLDVTPSFAFIVEAVH